MYLRALQSACATNGGLGPTTCPSIVFTDTIGHWECVRNCDTPVDTKSETATQTESAESTTKVAAETVSNEPVLADAASWLREAGLILSSYNAPKRGIYISGSPRAARLLDKELQLTGGGDDENWRMPDDDPTDPGATPEQLIEKYGPPI